MGGENKDLFTIKKDDKVGRHAVASENLKPGDLIFSEKPFAYGPKSDGPPLCLGCLNPVDCVNLCTKCSWPVCNPECENLPVHRDAECKIFQETNIKFQAVEDSSAVCLQYECILPLRTLLAKERDPKRWQEEVEPMEAHNEIRKTKPIWEFNKVNIVDYLRGPCKQDRFSEDLIHTVCGILEVNAFEARTQSGYLIRCLYPKLAILSHNCVSNIHHTIGCLGNGTEEDFEVTVRAAVEVPKGGELFSSYTYSLWPTLVRRESLRESKYFDCNCARCTDKTELETHMGTLKCNKCDNGIILSTEPLSDTCEWKCTHCEFKTNAVAVRKVYAAIQSEIDAVENFSDAKGIEIRESIFKKYRSVLHPRNAYMQNLRAALSQLYGRVQEYTIEELPDLLLERKIEFCQELLKTLDVIEPGHSRIRGITLYELHAPLMYLARSQYNADAINKEQFRKKMEEALKILGESVEILKHEAPSSSEGQLAMMAQQAYEGFTQNFEMLIEAA